MNLRFVYPIKDNIYRIIDGDTISVILDRGFRDTKEVSVRLIGLNAPESRTRRTLEKEAGLLVKAIVVKWLKDHKDKQLFATSEAKPKYAGRTVGRVWAGSESENCLNTHLLSLGVVKIYIGGKRNFSDEELSEIISKSKEFLSASN
jgi:endonuclease YncB( thermonuclease family)